MAVLPLLAWSGASCDDGCGRGTADCGEAISVAWSADQLPESALVRLCIDGRCNAAVAPYANPQGGDISAPPWNEPIPDEGVGVRLELLEEDDVTVAVVEGPADPASRCGCRAVRLRVSEDGESLVEG
jgi:hypothetical protein